MKDLVSKIIYKGRVFMVYNGHKVPKNIPEKIDEA